MTRLTKDANNSILSSKPIVRWLLFILLWTVVALFWASRTYMLNRNPANPMSWWESYLLASVEWYLWGAASLLIYRICKWYGSKQRPLAPLILLHVLLAGLFSLLILVPYNMIYRPIEAYFMSAPLSFDMAGFWDSYKGWFMGRFHLFIIDYALITVGCYALLMYERFRTEELRTSRLQTEISQMQLQALKAQLHPHFLFNTLNTISSLVHKDPDGAERMISRLGDLLRLTLQSNHSQVTSLRKEMEFTQLYLEIQKIRFSDRLNVDIEIAPETLEAKIPALLLQPLVENAIVHGISPRTASGTVKVVAMRKHDRLHLTIADDGVGIKTDGGPTNGGIGLKNIQQRLKHLYGEHAQFALSTFPNSGVKIEIEIPFEVADDENGKPV